MHYAVHNVPSYQNLQGKEMKSHMGSQSHHGNMGPGQEVHNPGGYTAGHVGHGSSTHLSHGMHK